METKESYKYIINRVFSDIINGYSSVTYQNKLLYVKHFNVFDESEVEAIKEEQYKLAIKKGLKTEGEQIEFLIKNNLWSEKEELELNNSKEYLSQLNADIKIAWLPSQKKQKQEDAKNAEIDYNNKLEYKENLIGITAEKYASKYASNYYIYKSLYLDSNFQNQLYKYEDFQELDGNDLEDLILIFNKALSVINEENIKKTACSTIFQNVYRLSEDNYQFIGKPICHFTYYQISLLNYGNYYKHIMGELKDSLPENYQENPNILEERYNAHTNMNKILSKSNPNIGNQSKTMGIMGATEEDMKALGISNETSRNEKKIQETLKERGEIGIMEAIGLGF